MGSVVSGLLPFVAFFSSPTGITSMICASGSASEAVAVARPLSEHTAQSLEKLFTAFESLRQECKQKGWKPSVRLYQGIKLGEKLVPFDGEMKRALLEDLRAEIKILKLTEIRAISTHLQMLNKDKEEWGANITLLFGKQGGKWKLLALVPFDHLQ